MRGLFSPSVQRCNGIGVGSHGTLAPAPTIVHRSTVQYGFEDSRLASRVGEQESQDKEEDQEEIDDDETETETALVSGTIIGALS